MKNLISFLTVATFLFFTSCSKDSVSQFETDAAVDNTTVEASNSSASTRAQMIEYFFTVQSESQTATELTLDLLGDYDFTNAIVDGTQTLSFENSSGTRVDLTFQVNSYVGGDRTLLITFAKGRNNLSGLHLDGTQGIIIEEGSVE